MCYDIKNEKWTKSASMITIRQNASCAVFKGEIVVTGGYKRSSELYCFHENKWTQFADMSQGRIDHGTVSIGNKLFVIGGD